MLHYKIDGNGPVVVLLHGLFGSLDNLGILARALSPQFKVVSIDLPNHGKSEHVDQVSYQQMATAVVNTLHALDIHHYSLVGHSMGGKVAMQIAANQPDEVQKLAVLDMAPVKYSVARHTNVLKALNSVANQQPTARAAAMSIMNQHLEDPGVAQFLGKSLYTTEQGHLGWRFNFQALETHYWSILDWQEIAPVSIATQFIIGANSDYVLAEHKVAIAKQFPQAKAHMISNAGHWLHAEKPEQVARTLLRFLATD